MANKGLKSYTKQLSGSIGSIGYNVNVNYNDSNLILTLPLLESGGINSVGLSLIYNHQNKSVTSAYGAGMKTDFEYKMESATTGYNVTNPDGSVDLYTLDEVIDGHTSHPTFIYKSKTSDFSLVKETIYTSGIEKFYLKDKMGNKYWWKNGYDCISNIECVNGFTINYKPENGVLIDNNEGTEITYTLNSLGNMNQLFCYEYDLEQSRTTFGIRTADNFLSYLILSYAGIVTESYSFDFENNYIRIKDTKKDYAVVFTLTNDKVTRIDEEYYGYVEEDDGSLVEELLESRLLYQISSSTGESVITNTIGDTLTVKFNEDDLPTLEYDDKGNIRLIEYNSNNLVTFKSNVINPSKLALHGQRLTTPISSTDLSYSTSQSTGLPSNLGFNQVREISNSDEVVEGREKYEATFEGEAHEAVTLVAFAEQKTACEESYGGYIQAVLFNDETVVGSAVYNMNKDTQDTEAKMVVLGIVPKTNYNKIVVNVVALNVTFEYTDLIVCKYNFGTFYSYDSNMNVNRILTGFNTKVLGYSDNYIESEAVKGNSEKTYKYDDKKNPLKTVNCYGVKTTNEYDEDTNELIKKTITSEINGSIDVDFTYDNGDLIQESDSTGNTVDYSYDDYHREDITTANSIKSDVTITGNDVSKIEVSTLSSVKIADIDYQYDDKKNIKTITCENGSVYDFTYDDRNRLTKVTLNGRILVELSYDYYDKVITKKYGNNNYFTFEYVENLLSAIKYGSLNRYSITYDPYERVKTITNILANITTVYDYDSYDRISKVTEGNSYVEYKYNEADNDVNIVRNIEGFKVTESHNNLVQTNVSSVNKLRGLFNENKRYVGSMCINDSHLRGNYDGQTYIYPTTFDNDNLCITDKIKALALLTNDARNFIVSTNDDTLEGGFGYWYKANSGHGYSYSLVDKSNEDDTNAIYLLNEEGQLVLMIKENGSSRFVKRISSDMLSSTGFNFIFLTWKAYLDNGVFKLKYNIRLNETYYEEDITTSVLLELDNNYYHVGKVRNSTYGMPYGYLTGLMMSIDGKLTTDEIEEYYKLTKMYLINDPQRDLRDNSVDYQVSSIYLELSGYEIYPLHGNANSLSGKKPNKYNLVKTNIHDKASCYNYNVTNNRYCFEASGNNLEYSFGNASSGTISMMVYPYNRSEIQYLFEGYDASNNRVSVFIDSDNKVNIKVGNVTNNTRFVITKNAWNYIGFSYSPNISSATNIRIVVNSNKTSSTINSGVTLGTITTIVGSNKENTLPLYGQIEMLATSSSIKSTSQLETLRDSLKVVSKTNEIDDLGRLIRYGVSVNGENIISNSIQYKTNNSSPTTKVSAETIKATSSKTTLATRSYTYATTYDKNNITTITDSVFGSKSCGYNNRGFLTNDNGTSISYDSNGNIKTYGTKSFTYDSTIKDRLMSVGGYAITYSSSNPLLPAVYKDMYFTYEGNRLTCVEKAYDSETTIYYRYYYNHEGLRIKKVETHEYTDDRDPYTITTYYYYEGNRLITEYRSDTDRIDYLYDSNGLLYGFINNKTERFYYVRDILQNILGIVDSNGNLVVKYDCNAYGDNQIITGSNTTIGLRNPFRYKGYYYDEETGFFWCNSRYYNPEWGRWLTPDDVEYLEPENINGLNLYSYCMNNPIMYSDPSGHIAISTLIVGAIIGFVVGGATSAITQGLDKGWDNINGWQVLLDATIGGISGALGASGINQVVSMIAGGVLGAAGSVAGDIIAVKGDFSQLNVWKVVGKAAIMGAIGVGLGRWTGAGTQNSKAMVSTINAGKSWGSKAFLTSAKEAFSRPNSGLTLQTMYMNMAKAISLYTVQGITKVSVATLGSTILGNMIGW